MTKIERAHAETSRNGDVWRGAFALIDGYGQQAPTQAARKAMALVARGDTEGYLMWLRILQAANTILEENKTTETASLVA